MQVVRFYLSIEFEEESWFYGWELSSFFKLQGEYQLPCFPPAVSLMVSHQRSGARGS